MNNLTLVGVIITVLPIVLIIVTVVIRGKKLFD